MAIKGEVRKATLADIEPLTDLFEGYRTFYKRKPDREGAKKFLTARISNKDSAIFVSLNNDGILTGFVQLYPLFSSTRMRRTWLLNDLFVKLEYRGQGYSMDLIESAKELCRTTRAYGMMLETETSNDIGNNLYPKMGFKKDMTHNFYAWEV